MCKETPENLSEVETYFQYIGSDKKQANWFYDHFESNGWRVSGKAKMKNWRAAARNWNRRADQWGQPTVIRSKLERMKVAFARRM